MAMCMTGKRWKRLACTRIDGEELVGDCIVSKAEVLISRSMTKLFVYHGGYLQQTQTGDTTRVCIWYQNKAIRDFWMD